MTISVTIANRAQWSANPDIEMKLVLKRAYFKPGFIYTINGLNPVDNQKQLLTDSDHPASQCARSRRPVARRQQNRPIARVRSPVPVLSTSPPVCYAPVPYYHAPMPYYVPYHNQPYLPPLANYHPVPVQVAQPLFDPVVEDPEVEEVENIPDGLDEDIHFDAFESLCRKLPGHDLTTMLKFQGEKHLFSAKNTPENIEVFKKYEKNFYNYKWIGELLAGQWRRGVFEKGSTIFIPGSYIHFVWTQKDNIMIGGNFLMESNLEQQFKKRELSNKTWKFSASPNLTKKNYKTTADIGHLLSMTNVCLKKLNPAIESLPYQEKQEKRKRSMSSTSGSAPSKKSESSYLLSIFIFISQL
ncbi:hypothetical protein CAEBREN_04719 [Caenorhabditis brenneri]|uniref:JmjC domain-containing protein n=1 Tax=Caenorhabditis brenneri TaxID=135651 RepID=G0NS35_CAEBE|nr:hypothetical protein CAEBREN_04719 [Caenorhabditis brenneri]